MGGASVASVKRKKLAANALHVRVYDVLSDAVDSAAGHAARRLTEDYEHRPSDETIREVVRNEVLNAISERFEFPGVYDE